MKMTAEDMKSFGIIDEIISEPLGGAHTNVPAMANELKKVILKTIRELEKMNPDKRIEKRMEKFFQMGAEKEK